MFRAKRRAVGLQSDQTRTDAAEADCSAGHDALARSVILAVKKRHGYPAEL
jgi:hypothetical protein